MTTEKEIWKPIRGYETTYEVSTLGRIMRIDKQRILKAESRNTYLQVNLCQQGAHWVIAIHLLVARTFLEDCPEGYEVNHKDLNKHNNCLSNLEYVTPKQNIHHAAKNHARKDSLDNEIALLIRKEANQGYAYKEIAARYNSTVAQVMNICTKDMPTYGTSKIQHRKIMKMTERDVQGVLLLKSQGYLSQNQIAQIYELDKGAISRIVNDVYKSHLRKGKS